ncbi:hypothetical protein HMN09_00748600 [Mycena chlorophos]|uniref:Uncharacterized protein n=1 Tax=Mycena chlorophos TaxID=658473 RepID=A0A8H6W5S9_MYCCL|nr:hypothetical protein HMN09_00748600 [Mycena chlorophos]
MSLFSFCRNSSANDEPLHADAQPSAVLHYTPGSVLGVDITTPLAAPTQIREIEIPGTPYSVIIWSNVAGYESGLWSYHLAISGKPYEPIDLAAAARSPAKILLGCMEEDGWDMWEAPLGNTRTAGTDTRVGVRMNGIDFPAADGFPPPPCRFTEYKNVKIIV